MLCVPGLRSESIYVLDSELRLLYKVSTLEPGYSRIVCSPSMFSSMSSASASSPSPESSFSPIVALSSRVPSVVVYDVGPSNPNPFVAKWTGFRRAVFGLETIQPSDAFSSIRIVAGDCDSQLGVWNYANDSVTSITEPLERHWRIVSAPSLLPDDIFVGGVSSPGGAARRYNLVRGVPVGRYCGHVNEVRGIAVDAERSVLYTGSQIDRFAKMWSVESFKVISVMPLKRNVHSAYYAEDLNLVLFGLSGPFIELIDPRNPKISLDCFPVGTDGAVWDIDRIDKRRFVSAGGSVATWRTSSRILNQVGFTSVTTSCRWIQYDLESASQREEAAKLRFWQELAVVPLIEETPTALIFVLVNWETGTVINRPNHGCNPWAGLQLEEELFAVSGDNNEIKIYSTTDWTVTRALSGHSGSSRDLKYIVNGNRLASGSTDQTCRVWDYETGQCLQTFSRPGGNVLAIDHIPELLPNVIFVPSDDNNLYVWDFVADSVLKTIDFGNDVDGICHDASRGIIWAANDSGLIKVIDIRDDYRVVKEFNTSSATRTMTYRTQAEQMLCLTSEGNIHLWDIRAGVENDELRRWSGHSSHSAYGCCDVYNGECFITASWDEHIKCWDNEFNEKWDLNCNDDVRGVTTLYDRWRPILSGAAALPTEDLDEARLGAICGGPGSEEWMRVPERRGEVPIGGGATVECPSVVAGLFAQMTPGGLGERALNIEEKVLTSIVFGNHDLMRPKTCPDYFLLFKNAGLKKHAYLVARHVLTLDDIPVLFELLQKSMQVFQEDLTVEAATDDLLAMIEEEGETEPTPASAVSKSGLTLALLNSLKGKLDEIKEDADMLKSCHRKGLFTPIIAHVEKEEIYEHSDFGLTEEEAPNGFGDLAREYLHELFQSGKGANVRVKSAADGRSEIPAHLEVLFLRSEVVADALRHESVRQAVMSDGVLLLDKLPDSKATLSAVVESIYCGSLQTDDLATLVRLWDVSKLSRDEILVDLVEKRLKEVCSELVKNKTLEAKITAIVHLIPDHLVPFAGKMWPSIGEQRLLTLKNSMLVEHLSSELNRLQENCNARFTSIEAKLTVLDASMQQLLVLVQK